MANDPQIQNSIVESFKIDIQNAQNDVEKKAVELAIKDTRIKGFIDASQEAELLTMLGVVPTLADPATENADRKAWEGALNEKYQELRTAKLKVADIKEELKQAKKALKLLQDELNNEVAQGSKDYQNRERTLFDNV